VGILLLESQAPCPILAGAGCGGPSIRLPSAGLCAASAQDESGLRSRGLRCGLRAELCVSN
jgi:hypothetical protein